LARLLKFVNKKVQYIKILKNTEFSTNIKKYLKAFAFFQTKRGKINKSKAIILFILNT